MTDCQRLEVPLNYSSPESETISLFVRTVPAKVPKQRAILLLAGGPGESGASFYAELGFFQATFPEFDLIIPDHRGTGYSTKLCEPEENVSSVGGVNLVGDEWGTCFGALYANLARTHAFNLDNAAQDVASIINGLALEGEIYLYGVSYGTSLALAVAERTDAKVSGLILDSLTPLPGDAKNDLSHRSHITDQVGQVVLQRCAQDTACPLGEGAQAIYAELLSRIDAGEMVSGLSAVPNGDLRQFLGLLLDVPPARQQIPALIAAMAASDEAAEQRVEALTEIYEAFWSQLLSFEQAPMSIPLSAVMSGSEFNARKALTSEQVEIEKAEFGFASPLPDLLASSGFPFYEPAQPVTHKTVLPPMLVMQGTLDPKTPYRTALDRVEYLRERAEVSVLTLNDAPHAAYLTAQDCLGLPLQAFVDGKTIPTEADCTASEASLSW
ncbi:MAG: alpha/beta fold hydrolase [Pseudomonadota bacterium]